MRCFIVLCVLIPLSSQQDFGQQDLQCGGIFTKKQFSIQSPDFPENYGRNLNCEYVFKGQGCPAYYNLQFLDFVIENSLGCIKDRLEIGQVDVLCGKQVGIKNYLARNGDLTLKFVSDLYYTGMGFNILVTRQPCLSSHNETKLEQLSTQNCCRDIYDQKKFTITNPGFPHSKLTNFDCEYKIKRANERICRLRLDFKYYWNGVQERDGCTNGYLEIDNKKICGCRSGLKLTTSFDAKSGDIKVIKYKTDGYSGDINGFAIEIFQDECPKKHETWGRRRRRFVTFNDWNEMWQPQKTSLLKQGSTYSHPSLYKHFYYFEPPMDFFGSAEQKEVEEAIYVDVSKYNPTVSNDIDNNRCRVKKSVFKNTPKCGENPNENDCIILDSAKGQFHSDGYPFWYKRNLNKCYRFLQLPGYCSVKLHMLDFNLQRSYCCQKDYVSLGNSHRYCGNDLCNRFVTLGFNNSYIDFKFVTDSWYCGRGFRVRYEQQLCNVIPTTTPETITTTVISTEEPLPQSCGGVITDEVFNLEVYGNEESTCRFIVNKINESVCTLDINFVDFDLICDDEYLHIDDRIYCRHLTNTNISIGFEKSEIVIIYKRTVPVDVNRRFLIRATQNHVNCSPDLEPSPDNKK